MQDSNAGAITGDPTEDAEDYGYWDIAQNEQVATPDGPMSREELEEADAEGVFVSDYRL
jgi:hypothetical protein